MNFHLSWWGFHPPDTSALVLKQKNLPGSPRSRRHGMKSWMRRGKDTLDMLKEIIMLINQGFHLRNTRKSNTCKEYGPLRIYTTIYLSNASHTCTFLPVAARVRIKPSACSRYLLIFMIKPHNTLRHVSKETFNVHLVEISLTRRTCWYTLVLCGLLKNTSTSSLETPKVAEKQENWTKSTMWYGSKVYFLPHTRPNDSSLSVALERRNLKEKTKWNTESLTIYIILGIKGCNKPSPGLVSITLSEARPPKGGIQNLQTFDFILSSTFLGCHLQIGKKNLGFINAHHGPPASWRKAAI